MLQSVGDWWKLLKEQNNPGDIFFIELAYSLMSENNLSDSDYLSKILNDVKELNDEGIETSSIPWIETKDN